MSATLAGLVSLDSGCAPPSQQAAPSRAPVTPIPGQADLSIGLGEDPAAITEAAVAALGGMQRFVRKGDQVIIKPNICVDYYPPEYAVTTNPQVVGALVRLALEAGAQRVRVMDWPTGGTALSAYAVSGIGDAVQAAGGTMEVMSPAKFANTAIPKGRDIKAWQIYRDVLQADVLINVPIAKHHSLARLTLGAKNLLGVVRNASQLHSNLSQRVADVLSVVQPTLTVVDAVRILTTHGPTGGSLNDVRQTNTVIASQDPVAADAWAATLFSLTGADIGYVRAAADMGLGSLRLDELRIEEVHV